MKRKIAALIPELPQINWIIFRENGLFLVLDTSQAAVPKQPQFNQAVAQLNKAILTDWDWMKEHTRLQTRALEWERRDKNASYLPRGVDVQKAEHFLLRSDKYPRPTRLQRAFVIAGRQEEARQQRQRVVFVSAALVIMAVLFVLASVQRAQAEREAAQRATAQAQAEEQRLRAEQEVETSLASLLAI